MSVLNRQTERIALVVEDEPIQRMVAIDLAESSIKDTSDRPKEW